MMIWFFIISMLCAITMNGQEQNAFVRANEAYDQCDYRRAVTCYQEVDQKGYATWHNMACCFEYLNEPVQRLLCLKRALPHASYKNFVVLKKQIQVLEKQLGTRTRLDEPWVVAIKSLVHYSAYHISIYILQILFFLCWYSFLFFGYMYRKTTKYNRIMKLLCIKSLLITMSLIVQYRSNQYQQGMIIKQQVPVMVGPCQDYHVLYNLPIADQVYVLESKPEWFKIYHNSGIGWVKQESIAII